MVKKWYQSKLVWLGVLTSVIGALQLLVPFLEEQSYQPASITQLIIGVLMVILRIWFTDQEIG